MTIVGSHRNVKVEIHETNRVDVKGNGTVLTSIRLTTQHEVTGIDISTSLGHTAEIYFSALTLCNILWVGAECHTLIDVGVAGKVVSLSTFQIEYLVLSYSYITIVVRDDIVKLHGVVCRDVIDIHILASTNSILSSRHVLDEDRSAWSTLGALHYRVVASVNLYLNRAIPCVDVINRVLRQTVDSKLSYIIYPC